MAFFFVIIIFLAVAAAITVPVIIMYTRRQARDQKNYERGLKMVPLLIHLPPISEDTDLGGRDVRDLVDENISKAQVIYNIVAGTFQKGFKRKLYGQQHFSFEIISSRGFVYFYTTVPIGLVEVVRQAIVSAYPAARLEETEEHNIFSPVGKASATTGGELVLKENFAYPIATYVDLKRDAMQAMLNALSGAGKEDGAAIQILMRPADPIWRSEAHELVKSKRKGEDAKGGGAKAMGFAKDFASAFVKPPEGGANGGGSDKPELSNLDEQILQSIEDKTRYPAFEVLIRVVASSNVTQRAQGIANQIVSSFSLFEAQGKNGFKYEPARDIDELTTAYIMKFFPQQNRQMILNSVELATIFHFPDQRSIPTSQLERQDSKQVDGPRNMPEEGLLMGYNVFRGVKKPVRLGLGDRQRHMYVVGQTGTGKSTFLENLALQDMMSGNGFAFVDPHGDTAEKLLSMVPKERSEDIIYFCPADMDYPMGLNLFEYQNPDQKDFLIQEALNMLKKLYDPNNQGIMGPRYEHLFRNAALTVMADPEGGTFIDIPKLFRDPQYVKQKLQYVKDLNVLEFWQKEMPQSQRSNEFGEVVSWFVSKFGAFLSNEMMRNIIGQTKSAFNLREIMDNKKILLVNLSKGRTGDLNSKLLGMVFVMQFQAAAMSRANIPESERVDFSLYVDEFQNFSTESFATIMSEARKFRLNLIVANQFTTQLSEEIRDAVFGNIGTIVAFRIGQNDVDSLSRYFQPTFDGDDLLRVPNYNAIVRTLIGGVPTQPFSMATLPPLGEPNVELSKALKQLSAAKFGRPKAVVEKEIFERISTKDEPAPGGAFGAVAGGAGASRPFGQAAGATPSPWGRPSTPAGGFGAGAAQPFGGAQATPGVQGPAARPFGAAPATAAPTPPAPRTGTGSFLDEWLTKRPAGQAGPVGPAPGPMPTPSATPGPVAPMMPPAPTPIPAPAARDEASLTEALADDSTQSDTSPVQESPNVSEATPDSTDVQAIDDAPKKQTPLEDDLTIDELDDSADGDSDIEDDAQAPQKTGEEDESKSSRKRRKKRRSKRKKTDSDAPHDDQSNASFDDDAIGVVEIGNTYDRNLMPSNHAVVEDVHEKPVPPQPQPLAVPAAPVVAAEPYEPQKPAEPVASAEAPVNLQPSPQPLRSRSGDSDWLPKGGPTLRSSDSGPQSAYPDPVTAMVDELPADDSWRQPRARPPGLAHAEDSPSEGQPSEDSDDLNIDDLKRLAKPGERHLNHGDTIYIDKDGELKEIAPEDAGNSPDKTTNPA